MYLEYINEGQLQSLFSELGTTEEIVRNGTRYLMEWLEKQPHLPNVKDEDFIFNILLINKNRLEVAKQQLENLYVARAMIPEVFGNRRDFLPEFEVLCRRGFLGMPLPKLTPDGYRVAIFSIGKHTAETMPSVTTWLRLWTILFDITIKSDRNKGFIAVIDVSNMSAIAVPAVISLAKNYRYRFMKLYKNRAHKIYVLNMPTTFHWLVNFVMNMLPKNITNRVTLWEKDIKDLAQELPKHILPSNYGGDEKCIQDLRNEVYEYHRQFYDWVCAQENVKADLTKITAESKFNFSEFEFGIDGSFRTTSWE